MTARAFRFSQEFLDLQAAAARERYTIAAARKRAAEIIDEAIAETHPQTVAAAKRFLEAGASDYMVGQAAGVSSYSGRSKLAAEAREAVFEAGTTAASFTVTPPTPGEEAIYAVALDTGRVVYLEWWEDEALNAPAPDGTIEDGLAILEERGFLEGVADEIRRLCAE